MARSIVIHCDRHLASEVEIRAQEELTIAIGKKAPRIVAPCPECFTEVFKTALEWIEEYGVPVTQAGPAMSGTKPAPGSKPGSPSLDSLIKGAESGVRRGKPPAPGSVRYWCIWCPLDFVRASFAGHVRVHGFESQADAWGEKCPVCGEVPNAQNLGYHAVKQHPEHSFTNASDLFIWARDNGDPHGIYAERVAAGKNVRVS